MTKTYSYATLKRTKLGNIQVAIGPSGVVGMALDVAEETFAAVVERWTGVAPRRNAAALAPIFAELRDYLSGKSHSLNVKVDWSILRGFQRAVLEEAARVPAGSLITYGAIARRIGRPRAARAVGQALRRNPMPLAIPCHRVIGADGSLRGYDGPGGIEAKRKLLLLEGASLL